MKRSSSEFDESSSAGERSFSPSFSPSTPLKKVKKESKDSSKTPSTFSPKLKLPQSNKQAIAKEIISKGVQSIDLEALMAITGLTKQQIKSQLALNRNNIRKQLMDLAQTLA
ncbi:hypothetical protein BD324DRAFT_653218 [Kockovaella imperatae]|uniref:Uncharacterized protein n=1 Tax=Kockovaella imperatae TaxID=4999 RepID=A0A1Y1U8S4_9TREE|nr:hypothetical protein BD324DRAFT_653218 [Kockovaella imperatae]ORX34441.1 hypothetical protein BD324DRAFT_653218 [Kockovaella imperatae]